MQIPVVLITMILLIISTSTTAELVHASIVRLASIHYVVIVVPKFMHTRLLIEADPWMYTCCGFADRTEDFWCNARVSTLTVRFDMLSQSFQLLRIWSPSGSTAIVDPDFLVTCLGKTVSYIVSADCPSCTACPAVCWHQLLLVSKPAWQTSPSH